MDAMLGQGGFAITYLAYDTILQQKVAIKKYFPVRYINCLRSCVSNSSNKSSQIEGEPPFNYQRQVWFIRKAARKKNI